MHKVQRSVGPKIRSKSTGKPYFWNVKLGISQLETRTFSLLHGVRTELGTSSRVWWFASDLRIEEALGP